MTVLVTGATGNVGGALVRQLAAAGVTARAMTRDPERARFPDGVDVVRADLAAPSTLDEALKGVDRVFLMGAPPDALASYTRSLCDAAVRSDVRHVVLLSSMSVEIEGDTPLTTEHGDAEKVLMDSGLGYTLLRPGPFNTLTFMWAESIKAEGRVRHPFGDPPGAPIDAEDIAAVALCALTSDEHIGRAYSITGPQRLRPSEQAQILAQVLGRALMFEEVPEADAVAFMTPLAGPHAAGIVAAMRREDLPWSDPMTTVEEITGRPPATFRSWAERHAHAFGGA
jgi:(4-alkanoyl-5-oxo-2,5-dihydrofuran-3-yl)methyl phosphate reductase